LLGALNVPLVARDPVEDPPAAFRQADAPALERCHRSPAGGRAAGRPRSARRSIRHRGPRRRSQAGAAFRLLSIARGLGRSGGRLQARGLFLYDHFFYPRGDGGTTRSLGALEVGRTLGGVAIYEPDPLEDQLCEECQNSLVTVILSSGQALCTACAAIRFRIPTTDRAKLRAAIEAGTSAGAHWPRNS
jgi:hypothetical protein